MDLPNGVRDRPKWPAHGAGLLVTGELAAMTAGLVALAAVPAAPKWLLAALMVLAGLGGRW